MKVVSIKSIKPNPKNPRTIRSHKFKKLVESITTLPEMLLVNPIKVDEDMVILGGNQRFKACLEAGLTDVSIEIMKGLTEAQKDEFIIKDNAHFGEWDYDVLANTFDAKDLNMYGLNVWTPESYQQDESDEPLDLSNLEAPNLPQSESNPKILKKVIQLEFLITDYDEAFGLVTLLRAKGIDLGEVLINTMKRLSNEND
tara:strand:+ start:4796 stop:5392 length:597 start_codon:yes stop_codon:yes gene_type:complete